ncbi:MAG: hypothetical protein PHS66_02820 [Candidatus Omnitrophica bacterium]|nr:hypothetical protein [Candidatus Omnitrophota bacterium]
MGKIKVYCLCAIFFFSFLGLSFSQTILLKSGQKVEGKIIEQTDKYVKLDFEGIELTFYNDEIFSIDQSTSGAPNTLTPQMELLYKAYASSLKTTAQAFEDEIQKPAEAAALANQKKNKNLSTVDRLPSPATIHNARKKSSLIKSSTDKNLPKENNP